MRALSVVLAFTFATALAGPASAAAYMKFEGVDGESKATSDHRGWIEIGSVQFSAPPTCTPSGPGTATLGGVSANNLRALGLGATAARPAVIDILASPTGAPTYFRIMVRDALISSVTAGAAPDTAVLKFSLAQRTDCPTR
jgi:hypothetical protein